MLDQNNRPKAWEVLSSKTRVKDKWIDVRTDKCRAANGDVLDYHVLSYGDWVNVVPFEAETCDLILVDEYRHGIGAPVLGLVGGAVDKEDGLKDDEAACAAALREMREESGFQASDAVLALKSMPNPALQNNWVYSYIVFDATDTGDQAFDEGLGEFCITVKRDFVEVLAEISSGKLHMQAMHVAALWATAQHILKTADLPPSAHQLREDLRTFILG